MATIEEGQIWREGSDPEPPYAQVCSGNRRRPGSYRKKQASYRNDMVTRIPEH